jgi:pimeloyl-ACP methyl ester carboxylesterase
VTAGGRVERLLSVEAEDGLSLSGFAVLPKEGARACVSWMHGFGVRCDQPQCVGLGRELADRGIAFVAGDLRGHDGGATGARRGPDGSYALVRTGSWWEVFEESSWDVGAWLAAATSLDAGPVVLVGHSFGALRAVLHVSERAPAIAGLVLASTSFGLRRLDAAIAAQARELVEAGRGEELLPEGSWPRGYGTRTVSAQTYASWWRVAPGFFEGPRTRFADIRCPLLITYGTGGDAGGQAELDLLSGLATSAPRIDTRLLQGVTHGYSGGEAALAQALADWIDDAVASRKEA